MTIPIPETQSTLLTIYCYDSNGSLKPNAQIRIELVSGQSNYGTVDNGPITATANNTGIIQVNIAKGSNLKFKLDRLDNKSTKGSFFNGTNEDTLILEATID